MSDIESQISDLEIVVERYTRRSKPWSLFRDWIIFLGFAFPLQCVFWNIIPDIHQANIDKAVAVIFQDSQRPSDPVTMQRGKLTRILKKQIPSDLAVVSLYIILGLLFFVFPLLVYYNIRFFSRHLVQAMGIITELRGHSDTAEISPERELKRIEWISTRGSKRYATDVFFFTGTGLAAVVARRVFADHFEGMGVVINWPITASSLALILPCWFVFLVWRYLTCDQPQTIKEFVFTTAIIYWWVVMLVLLFGVLTYPGFFGVKVGGVVSALILLAIWYYVTHNPERGEAT